MYNPYSIKFPAGSAPNGDPSYLSKAGELFELYYKDVRISDGRQPRALAIQICDLLNSAFTNGVNDVKEQLDPVLAEYKERLDAFEASASGEDPADAEGEDVIDTVKLDKSDGSAPTKGRRTNKYVDV